MINTTRFTIPFNPFNKVSKGRIIGNWSGGASSAVACHIALTHYSDLVHLAFCDTSIEHPETYRFLFDFEKITGSKIYLYKSTKFENPESIWRHFTGLNFANGAPCSTELKRVVRVEQIQDTRTDWAQVFGFDSSEVKRGLNMSRNYPEINPVYPLMENNLSKKDVFKYLKYLGIRPPSVYKDFKNNNCLGDPDSDLGGCVQGGIGYWQKIRVLYPKKFAYMARIEHDLTDTKGTPVTMLRDQTKLRRGENIFLIPHPNYPHLQDLSMKKGYYKVESFECHGFCGTLD